jgi:chromosome segregation ATPase
VPLADNITEIIAGIGLAVTGGALWFRKAQTTWAKGGADVAGENSRQDVYEFMRQELQRMAEVNTALGKQVNAFQLENIQLNARLQTVTLQMTELQHENANLGAEIIELRNAIAEFRAVFEMCSDCPRKLNTVVFPIKEIS